MSSRKEEERNEKIIRGLLKLPPNRRCINCNSLGPQYVCTNFWTFVCTTCSGIHREFTHRVKSVSMAKFTTQEVDALQRGGNQRAREQFLNDWDIQRMRLPDNSNPDKIREFIKNVYVDKKFAGGRSSDKPPRDTQTLKGEEDHRRASSYHSFSQSPPYDHQYEERRYGRQAGMLTRKPGSDHGHYEGKLSSLIYSPGRQVEQMDEDRFANEGSGSRMSDYSVSSIGDPFRSDAQSPNFQVGGYSSPPLHASDIITEDMRPRNLSKSKSDVTVDTNRIPKAHRSASAGSFGSIDSNPISLKSANSGSLIDSVLEPDHTSGMQRAVTSTISSSHMSSAAHPTNSGLFNKKVAQSQSTSLPPPVDLFADFSQPSLVPPLEQKSASGIQQADTSTIASSQMSLAAHATNRDLFNQPVAQSQIASLAAPIDLFADFSQPSVLPLVEQKSEAVFLSGNEGWATFDFSHRIEPSEANIGIPPMASGEKGDLMRNIDLFPSMPNNSDWYSVQNPENRGPSSLVDGQWSLGFNEQETSDLRSLMPWNAFDDLTGKLPQTLLGITSQNSISQDLSCRPPASVDSYIGFQAPQAPEVQFTNVFLSSTMDDKTPAVATLLGTHGSNFSPSALPQMGGVSQERKAANPFDLPFDSDTEANNMFMNMSSLQTTLPDPQSPSTYLGGLPDPWFSQNSLASFIPSIPQGGLSYIGGQVPRAQMQNVPSQGTVASLGGNPFA